MTRSRRGALLDGQAPPRVRHAPNVRANSWEDVSDLVAAYGLALDEWQEVVLQAAMGERADGRWAASRVAMSVPRRNGKTQVMVARALAGILLFDEQDIVISAHEQATAREAFDMLVSLLESNPDLNRKVQQYGRAFNREYVRFIGGAAVRFKARTKHGGRGFGTDCLLLDEAQIFTQSAWAAILPTLSAQDNPQVWLLGTPPGVDDDGEVFGGFRDAGLAGTDSRLAYLEWSAEAGDDLDDPQVWAKANPAYPTRISHDAIADERSSMTDDQFAMERLGMWAGPASLQVIDSASWAEIADESSMAVDQLALAVDVSPDRDVASVAVAGQRADGLWHVALDEQRKGVGWMVPYLASRLDENPGVRALVIDGASPAASVVDELGRDRIRATTTTARQYAQACGQLFDGVMEGWLRHTDQPQVNAALSAARKRPLGDAWAWNRKNSASDITPIVAATLALWGAQAGKVRHKRVRRGDGRSRQTSRKAVVL